MTADNWTIREYFDAHSKLWVDTIKHKELWTALAHFGIELHYICLLKRYADQQATVLTDKESDMLEIKRGKKQGHPLCSLLFNTVLQAA